MPILYVFLGLVGLLLLLLLLVLFVPVWAHIVYDGELRVQLRVLGVPVTVLPSEDKPAATSSSAPGKEKTQAAKKEGLKQPLATSFRQDGVGATVAYLCELAGIAGKAIGDVLCAIVVDVLHLDLRIAAEDPQDTAVRYGQVCGMLYLALAAIESKIKIRRREWRVEPNFLVGSSAAYADVRLHIWVYRVAGAAIKLLVRYLWLNIKSTDIKEEPNYGKQ